MSKSYASGKHTWGKSHRFPSEIQAQRYAISRAKRARSGTMVYLTNPAGDSEQYDPGTYR